MQSRHAIGIPAAQWQALDVVPAPPTMPVMNEQTSTRAAAKAYCFDYLDRNAAAVACLNDNIFYFAELGMQEFETAKLMTALLEEAGFTVERGIAGFPTGFCASFGSGRPVIALHTEYDSNPDNSQVSGIAEHQPIVDGAPGHCEGHNVNAAVLVAAALAAKAAMAKFGLRGTLKIFGAPAEAGRISCATAGSTTSTSPSTTTSPAI